MYLLPADYRAKSRIYFIYFPGPACPAMLVSRFPNFGESNFQCNQTTGINGGLYSFVFNFTLFGAFLQFSVSVHLTLTLINSQHVHAHTQFYTWQING